MDTLIIPNWHPLLVHFTVALITVSAVFFVLAKIVSEKAEAFQTVAKWTLWVGAGLSLLTVAAGIGAYNSVNHDDVAHVVMKQHRLWAFVTMVAILIVAIWVWRAKAIGSLIVAACIGLVGLVGATGYLGSELVYRHGLGVMRLPAAAGGEGHKHAEGEGHDNKMPTAEESSHEHAGSEGHSESVTAIATNPVDVAAALSGAIKGGDHAAIDALMADDILILEGGHAQTSKADYMAGHMLSDMAFLVDINSEFISQEVGLEGDLAWVVTHSRMQGTYKEKPIDMPSREFLLMRKAGMGWKIIQVQWDQK